jgi:hypothetical protein
LRVGYKPVEFSYTGNSLILQPQNQLSFTSPAFYIGLETDGLSASLSFVNGLTGAKDERYLNLSLDYINKISFVRKPAFQLGIPFGLMTNLVGVQDARQNDDFSQTVFGFGFGAFTTFSIPDKVSFSVEALPSIGFSNSRGGLFGGSNRGLSGSARLNFLNLFLGRSLSVGYDYKYSAYDLDNDAFDYDLTYHLFTIGVSL